MLNKLFHFNITRDTGVAFGSAFIVILLSLIMGLFPGESAGDTIVSTILRDLLMILVIGFMFPLYYALVKKKEGLQAFGIKKEKLAISLIINIILGAGLLFMFMNESNSRLNLNYGTMCAVTYIAVAGIFEMIFIYGFLRHYLENSFGIIPAIIVTSVLYSLHHAGFQPEFLHLFFVGIMYSTVFYITKNIFIIFPVFWGVGAVWDVLVSSTAGSSITNTFSLVVSISVFICMVIYLIWLRKRVSKISLARQVSI